MGTLRFKCSVCSHKSRYKQGIIDHVKQVHRKERPYACTTCERSFFRKTDLRIHIRSVGLLSLLWEGGGHNSLHFWQFLTFLTKNKHSPWKLLYFEDKCNAKWTKSGHCTKFEKTNSLKI